MATSKTVHFSPQEVATDFLHQGGGTTIVRVTMKDGTIYHLFPWGTTVFVALSGVRGSNDRVEMLRYDLKGQGSVVPYILGAAKKMSKDGVLGTVAHAHVPGKVSGKGPIGFPVVSWCPIANQSCQVFSVYADLFKDGIPTHFLTGPASAFPAPETGDPNTWDVPTVMGNGESLSDALTGSLPLPTVDRHAVPAKDGAASEAPHNSPVLRNLRTPEQYLANLLAGLGK